MSTELLNDLLVSSIPEVAQAAARAKDITKRFEDKEITDSEFKELIDDIANLDRINRNMISLEQYREIVRAFTIIMALKGLASII